MHWFFLIAAGLLETVWAVGLKYAEGFSRPLPTVVTLVAMGGSFWFLCLAVRALPLGTAYAVWTGIGAVGAVIAGIVLFGEPAGFLRLLCVALIIAGIAGLKMSL